MKKILLVLLVIFFLRLPTLFEPYWYGDEGIYLALGQALQRGAVMYRDIWDNKPPLLYLIYALHPTLLWAKITATVFVLGTAIGTYFLTKSVIARSERSERRGNLLSHIEDCFALLAMTTVGVFLSLPLLEGTIANAELYFALPIVLGAYLIYEDRHYVLPALAIGLLLALAVFIKIPAGFDFAGMILAYFFIILFGHRHDPVTTLTPVNILPALRKFLGFIVPVILPATVLSLTFILYFSFHHALADFLTAAFSQNASYVAVGSGPLSQFSNPLFTKGILLAIGTGLLIALFYLKKISKELFFLSLWFGFSLYGALLSNRPYLHYLLQIVPPASILFFYLLKNIRKYLYLLVVYFLILFALIRIFTGAFALDSRSYYQNWFDYASERKLWTEYVNYFDSRTTNSYTAAEYLAARTSPLEPIFVWGDASFVYVLSNRPPATKFIQAHHLTTIPPINYDLIIKRLEKYQPKYIIISRPARFDFPKLEAFVKKDYRLADTSGDLYVYQNILPVNPPIFNLNYD